MRVGLSPGTWRCPGTALHRGGREGIEVDLRLGLCAVGSVIFFLEEGPLVKASELFKCTMSEHQLRLEEARCASHRKNAVA